MLREGELSAGVIQTIVGWRGEPLSAPGSYCSCRQNRGDSQEGNQAGYSPRKPVLREVFSVMRGYVEANLTAAIQMLGEIDAGPQTRRAIASG
jgi:hypothetical protein